MPCSDWRRVVTSGIMNFKEGYVNIDGRELRLTNLDKIFWPHEGYTKRDLILYYYKVAEYILPHLKDRPLTLKRYPNGVEGDKFFQKDVAGMVPEWVQTEVIFSESANEAITYVICNDRPTLVFLANWAAISQNPWLSRWPRLEEPDFFTLDLDPNEPATFKDVIETAFHVKEELDDFGLKGFVKTSGATGLHIYVPIKPGYSYAQARRFAELIATIVSNKAPKLTTIEHAVSKRGGRVYLDYLQNIKTKTLASVYSVRARPGATVSAPLSWQELASSLEPEQFNILNIFDRLKQTGDLFKGALTQKHDLGQALQNVS